MVAASHCTWGAGANSRPGFDYHLYGSGAYVGTSTDWAQDDVDVQLLDGAGYYGHIYSGSSTSDAYNGISGGTGSLVNGEWVCISGAYSGVRCGQVTNPYENLTTCLSSTGPCRMIFGTVEIQGPSGFALAGQGDSGSPAFQNPSGDTSADYLIAEILSSMAAPPIDCPAFQTIGGTERQCSRTVNITPWGRFRTEFSPDLTLTIS